MFRILNVHVMNDPKAQSISIEDVTLHRMSQLGGLDRYQSGMERIFFAASNTQEFESDQDRRTFLERWLGRYLVHDPEWVYLALAPEGSGMRDEERVLGYLVGATDDPARTDRFADIGYFELFRTETLKYPAHLHVNLDATVRGEGIGRRLVEMFLSDIAKRGVSGVHVVTGAGARNVSFYERVGFHEAARTTQANTEVIFLARPVASP